MTQATFEPNSDLSSVDGNRFVLFEQSWLSLQCYVTAALHLPIAVEDFTQRYGAFENRSLIEGCVEAMRAVVGLSQRFGSPSEVKVRLIDDPNYLGSTTPPDQLYGHMVWLGNQLANQASTFAHTYNNLSMLFQGSREENAANLTEVLTGRGGLTSTAETANEQVSALLTKLLEFDRDFGEANAQLQAYTSAESEILDVATSNLEAIEAAIRITRAAATSAHNAWRDYTIAATTSSISLIFTPFFLFSPVAAGVLGHLATEANAQYESLCRELSRLGADQKLKVNLVVDLGELNEQLINVAPAMGDFQSAMDQVSGLWTGINNDLLYIINNYTVEQLGDLSWVMQTLKVLDAQAKWERIGTLAQEFVQGGLVSFSSQAFGVALAA